MAILSTVIGRGVVASRPAAGSTGALYYATDVSGGQLQRDNGATWDSVEGAGSSATGTTTALLDYNPSTDIASAVTMGAAAWVDVCANQTFTVGAGTSGIEVAVSGNVRVIASSAGGGLMTRIVVDSAGTPINKLVGAFTATDGNSLAGANMIWLGSLTAGSHTIKVQAQTTIGGFMYCRIATHPEEFLSVRVFECK